MSEIFEAHNEKNPPKKTERTKTFGTTRALYDADKDVSENLMKHTNRSEKKSSQTERMEAKIESLKEEIWNEFGVAGRVITKTWKTKQLRYYKDTPSEIYCDIEPISLSEAIIHLQYIKEILRSYPPILLQKSGLKRITLVKTLQYPNKIHAGGNIGNKELVLALINTTKQAFFDGIHHEVFHILEGNIENEPEIEKTTRQQSYEDLAWAALNKNGLAVYTYNSGGEAIANGNPTKKRNKGFRQPYGQDGGPDEDQATFAEGIMSPFGLLDTISIARSENQTINGIKWTTHKDKLEMITGCQFENGVFLKTYTEEEYREKFKTPINYYSKWSRDAQGNPVMDHNWWNEKIREAKRRIPRKKK